MVELNDIISMQSDEDLKKNEAVKELFKFSEKDIDYKTKTDLSINDIKELTRLKLLADVFNIEVIDKLCDTFCLFLVSKNRLGRKEIVEMSQPKEKIETESKSFFKNLLNK